MDFKNKFLHLVNCNSQMDFRIWEIGIHNWIFEFGNLLLEFSHLGNYYGIPQMDFRRASETLFKPSSIYIQFPPIFLTIPFQYFPYNIS